MSKNKSKSSARSAKRNPPRANGGGKNQGKQLKMRNERRGGTDIIGATSAQIEAPSAVGFSQNAMRAYVRRSGSRRENGVEVVTYDFHQMLSRVANNTADQSAFPSGPGYNSNVPSLPMSPYFMGGALAKVAKPFRRYRFTNLTYRYYPSTATSTPNGYAFGYDPRSDLNEIVTAGEDGTFSLTGFYESVLQLASAAAGPTWGPMAVAVGGLLKKGANSLSEGALKWWENRKPTNHIDAVLIAEDTLDKFRALNENDTAVSDWAAAVKVALDGEFTIPELDLVPINTNTTVQIKYLSDAVRRIRTDTSMENFKTVQGMVHGAASDFLAGSGLRNTTGFLMVQGTIELLDPFGDTTSAGTTVEGAPIDLYGDPLDLSDAAGGPDHWGKTTGERTAYMFRRWAHTPLSTRFCDMVEKATGHRLHDQLISQVTSLELHNRALQRFENNKLHTRLLKANLQVHEPTVIEEVPGDKESKPVPTTRVLRTPVGVITNDLDELTDDEYVDLADKIATLTPSQWRALKRK